MPHVNHHPIGPVGFAMSADRLIDDLTQWRFHNTYPLLIPVGAFDQLRRNCLEWGATVTEIVHQGRSMLPSSGQTRVMGDDVFFINMASLPALLLA